MKRSIDFTLVELLVVVAVISILMSILLPTLKKAQDRAKTIKCTNNQKQLGNSVAYYLNDYNQFFYCPDTTAGKNVQWGIKLMKEGYFANGDLLCCPSIKGYETFDKTNSGWKTYGAIYTVSGASWAPHFPAFSMKKYSSRASNMMLFSCSYSAKSNAPFFRLYAQNDSSESYSRPYLIHNGFANLAFLDGHVGTYCNGDFDSIIYPIINFACTKNNIYIPVQ